MTPCLIFWTIVTAIIAGLVVYMILDKPRLVTPSKTGWVEKHKRINVYQNKEFSSDTDLYIERIVKSQNYYTIYGIRIRNDRNWKFGRAEANISSASIKMWNSKLIPVTDRYKLRLWEDHSQPETYPLFPKDKTVAGNKKTIGEGGTIDLVIAYNQENENNYYRFQVSTSAFGAFPAPRDLFKDPMPHFAVIEISANRTNPKIFLRIDEIKQSELEIKVISEEDFPLAKEEIA